MHPQTDIFAPDLAGTLALQYQGISTPARTVHTRLFLSLPVPSTEAATIDLGELPTVPADERQRQDALTFLHKLVMG